MENIELKNEIILKLLKERKIHVKEKIDYDKFCELYKDYSYLPKWYFANILDIDYDMFLKQGKCKATILSYFDYSIIKDDKGIILELKNLGIIDNNTITKDNFYRALELLPYLTQENLLKILNINLATLTHSYRNKNKAVSLPKELYLTLEEEKIIDDLINRKILIPGEYIDNDKFNYIHKLYPFISNERLIYILELSKDSSAVIGKGKSQILKSRINEYLNTEKNSIIKNLIDNKNVMYGESINYERFLELYSGYEYIDETRFAALLGINYNNFMSLKRGRNKVSIIKKLKTISDEYSNYIYNKIKNDHNLYDYCQIQEDLFEKICEEYPHISENLLRRILGIHPGNTFKRSIDKKIRICNGVKLEKIFHIRKYINESRFYTSDELIRIINMFGGGYHYQI